MYQSICAVDAGATVCQAVTTSFVLCTSWGKGTFSPTFRQDAEIQEAEELLEKWLGREDTQLGLEPRFALAQLLPRGSKALPQPASPQTHSYL